MFMQIYLSTIHCDQPTSELSADEPYVIVESVDFTATVSISGASVSLPASDAVLYGPFAGFGKGDTQNAPGIIASCWGIGNIPATLANPSAAALAVGLMENDDGNPESLRGIVKSASAASILGSLALPQNQLLTTLLRDINSALQTPTGFPNLDDQIGFPQLLTITQQNLDDITAGKTVQFAPLIFSGNDGAKYTLVFEGRLTWHPWFPINPENVPVPGPNIAALGPRTNHVDLYMVNGDGVWSTWWEPAVNWQQWFPIIGQTFLPGAQVSAAVRLAGDSGEFTEPLQELPPIDSFGPELSGDAPFSFHIDIFVMGSDGKVVWNTSWDPLTNWQAWRQVAPVPPFRVGESVTSLTPRDNHIDLFTTDGRLVWSTFWDGQV